MIDARSLSQILADAEAVLGCEINSASLLADLAPWCEVNNRQFRLSYECVTDANNGEKRWGWCAAIGDMKGHLRGREYGSSHPTVAIAMALASLLPQAKEQQ